jgi:post-segregation antitoxin (ccd killing protein)
MVTGRNVSMRAETEDALRNAGLNFSSLLMNPYSFKETRRWKKECAEKLHDATLAIDDNLAARTIYESFGIKSIHPDEIIY